MCRSSESWRISELYIYVAFGKSTPTLLYFALTQVQCVVDVSFFSVLWDEPTSLYNKNTTASAKYKVQRLSAGTHTYSLRKGLHEHTCSLQVQHGLWGPVPPLEGSLQWRVTTKKTQRGLFYSSASRLLPLVSVTNKFERRCLTLGALQDCETNDARSASVSTYVRVTALSRCVGIINRDKNRNKVIVTTFHQKWRSVCKIEGGTSGSDP